MSVTLVMENFKCKNCNNSQWAFLKTQEEAKSYKCSTCNKNFFSEEDFSNKKDEKNDKTINKQEQENV